MDSQQRGSGGGGGGEIQNRSRFCSRIQTEENHFLWGIENFKEAIRPEFIATSAKLTVLVGQTFGHKWKVTFQLEQPPPPPPPPAEHIRAQVNGEEALINRRRQALRQSIAELEAAADAAQQRLAEARRLIVQFREGQNREVPLETLQSRARHAAAQHGRIQAALRGVRRTDQEWEGRQQELEERNRLRQQRPPRQRPRPPQQDPPETDLRLVCKFETTSDDGAPTTNLNLSSKRLQLHIVKKRESATGDYYFDSELESQVEPPGPGVEGWTIPKIIPTSPVVMEHQLMLVDDALRIEIKLTLSKVCEANYAGEVFESPSSSPISKVVTDVISSAEDRYSDTVTMCCSSSGEDDPTEEITVPSSKAVLSARSPTLAGLFQRYPTQERFVIISDSRDVFHIFLGYLHTGKLPIQGFSSYPQILELAYLAKKYGSHELFSYCDEILADFCSMETASYLLCKTREYRLNKSSHAIMEYITNHSSLSRVEPHRGRNPVDRGTAADNPERDDPGIMNHNYTLDEIVTTGVLKEVFPFTWDIHSFKEIVANQFPRPANFQNTKVTGCLFNSEAQWEFRVMAVETDARDEVKVKLTCKYLSLSNPSREEPVQLQTTQNVHFRFAVDAAVTNRHAGFFWSRMAMTQTGQEVEIELMRRKDDRDLADENGALNLKLQLVVITNKNESRRENQEEFFEAAGVLRSFRKAATEKLQKDMESLYKSLPVFSDVTIVTKESLEFFAHWRFLAARCPAFKSMFQSDMQERRSGIINMEDVPHNAVDIMLYFIYTGRILDARLTTAADIIDVAHVADKYGLAELLNYCDDHFVEKCNLSNASQLLGSAIMYRLRKAQSAIQNFIRSRAGNSLEFADLLAGAFQFQSSS